MIRTSRKRWSLSVPILLIMGCSLRQADRRRKLERS
jgi:hypothetical protein